MSEYTSSKLVLSPEMVTDHDGFTSPAWIEAEGRRFYFDLEEFYYPGLYVEPIDNDGNIGPDSYWEFDPER
ncbi:hypothetical protein FDJ34_gp53 [Microbacterium phage Eleri]|uniref:Uncharacterized protein n=3 Tax=Elerivirus eleri TaxID=2560589 RepID=A0A2L0HNZ3_9CAUD|nr:hypothetical protein FDJ34_gp53 [Microbacterium phage Eleri]AUX83391.1 hypothetical protein SEA_ELERI_53 [Microbacterium phage Eleri]AXH70606.1 hypothetical protein SEA_COLACORTA_53 [Microbacterium phage ColaCorta]AXH70731.1 hypothetical protein SEA_ANDROMEDAS_53 [Microbacterium phage Andromedas]UDG79008.1 hypothetical protein SEA_SARATOS_53 [Microbacterium phage Saratos]